MRQEGNTTTSNVGCPGTPVPSNTAGSPNVGPAASILGDSNSMPSTSMEELHALHHLHSGVSSQVSFSDLYWRRLEMEEDSYSSLSSHLGWRIFGLSSPFLVDFFFFSFVHFQEEEEPRELLLLLLLPLSFLSSGSIPEGNGSLSLSPSLSVNSRRRTSFYLRFIEYSSSEMALRVEIQAKGTGYWKKERDPLTNFLASDDPEELAGGY